MTLKVVSLILPLVFSFAVTTPLMADEKTERLSDKINIEKLLAQRNFGALEEIAQIDREQKLLGPSGIWRLSHFYTYVNKYFDQMAQKKDCAATLPLAELWFSASRHSPTAIIVNAIAMDSAAWCYRGGGYADDVSAASWEPFNHYEKAAVDFLIDHKEDGSQDPQWYVELEIIARSSGIKSADFLKILNEGSSRFPLYYGIYDQGMIYYSPRWGGSNEAVESFAQMATEKTKSLIGDDMYARLYWYASDILNLGDLSKNSAINWPMMKASMEGLVKRYPDAWNFEGLARIACQSNDVAEGVKLLKQESSSVNVLAWESLAKDGMCGRDPTKFK